MEVQLTRLTFYLNPVFQEMKNIIFLFHIEILYKMQKESSLPDRVKYLSSSLLCEIGNFTDFTQIFMA